MGGAIEMSEPKKKQLPTIKRPHIIVCEGEDDFYFLIWYLNHLIQQSGSESSQYNHFQVDKCEGKDNLKRHLELLPKRPGFHEIAKSLIIIRDADTNATTAEQSVRDTLRVNNYTVPCEPCVVAEPSDGLLRVYTAYILLPGLDILSETGALEDFCLKIISHPNREELTGIADDAVDTASESVGKFSRVHKNKLHTFLSLTDKHVGMKIGESAKAGAFDFDSEHLSPLKSLMDEMLAL
jgi:hypothetical protein